MSDSKLKQYKQFINGEWLDSANGETFISSNPFDGQDWAEIPAATTSDVETAIKSARDAFENSWWRYEPRKRARALLTLADLLEKNAQQLGHIESTDNGKLLREMIGMNTVCATYYRYFAEIADHIFGDVIRGASADVFSYTLREPCGVVGFQIPWNTPSVILAQGAAPALAAGNTLVIKPSEFAPASTLEFARLVEEAGIPAGVVNVVTGMGAVVGAALCNNPGIDKIAFTGSPEAGRLVAAQAAQHLVPTVMELGGKSPNIVFEDANIDKAAMGVLGGFTAASGQSCVCGSRALIQESIYDDVVARVAEGAGQLKIGDPSSAETQVGPFCTAQQLEKVKHFVEVGKKSGARLVAGGEAPSDLKGWFFQPTVFADVRADMEIAQEEIFGPVLSVIPFKDEAEAVEIANNSRFGLGAGVWTRDLAKAHRMAAKIRAGTIWINQYRRGDPAFPFGGFGESGYGRQSGEEAINEFTVVKSIQIEVSADA